MTEPNALKDLLEAADFLWPFTSFAFEAKEEQVRTRTRPRHECAGLPNVECEDDLLVLREACKEFRARHEAAGHRVMFREPDEGGGYVLEARWDEPLTQEEVDEAKAYIDNYLAKHGSPPKKIRFFDTAPLLANSGKTLKWLRPVPFNLAPAPSQDGTWIDMNPPEQDNK